MPWLTSQACQFFYHKELAHGLTNESGVYFRIYRHLKQDPNSLYKLTKRDGLIWISPRKVDLLMRYAKVKLSTKEKTVLPLEDAKARPEKSNNDKIHKRRNIHPEKWEAKSLLRNFTHISGKGKALFVDCFNNYNEDVNERIIVLENKRPEFNKAKYKLLTYKHRFQIPQLINQRKKFDRIFTKLGAQHERGVFLTLTYDPARYDSLAQMLDSLTPNFNRFRAWLRKELKQTPRFISVREFTNKGRIHLHIVFFGISRIADKFTRLTPELVKAGFGEINYLYEIKKDKEGQWIWANKRNKPKDSNKSAQSYLKKYLTKATYLQTPLESKDFKIALYWASDKRFFTHSNLSSEVYPSNFINDCLSKWRFIGSFNKWDIPFDFISESANPFIYSKMFHEVKEKDDFPLLRFREDGG